MDREDEKKRIKLTTGCKPVVCWATGSGVPAEAGCKPSGPSRLKFATGSRMISIARTYTYRQATVPGRRIHAAVLDVKGAGNPRVYAGEVPLYSQEKGTLEAAR